MEKAIALGLKDYCLLRTVARADESCRCRRCCRCRRVSTLSLSSSSSLLFTGRHRHVRGHVSLRVVRQRPVGGQGEHVAADCLPNPVLHHVRGNNSSPRRVLAPTSRWLQEGLWVGPVGVEGGGEGGGCFSFSLLSRLNSSPALPPRRNLLCPLCSPQPCPGMTFCSTTIEKLICTRVSSSSR